jgi:hypothetical protein
MPLLTDVRTQVHQEDRGNRRPIIQLVDDDSSPARDEMPEALQASFVRKPVALPDLLDAVHRLLTEQRAPT